MFVSAAQVGFFSFIFGMVIRSLFGPLSFLITFLLVQSHGISACLAIGVFNVSAFVQYSLILNLK